MKYSADCNLWKREDMQSIVRKFVESVADKQNGDYGLVAKILSCQVVEVVQALEKGKDVIGREVLLKKY